MPEQFALPLARQDIDALLAIVGAAGLRSGRDIVGLDPGWAPDNLGAGVIVSPASTEDVARVVRHCAARCIGIVAHGGKTGLVGGGISRPGEIVLSLARMCTIEPIDSRERVAIVGAGAVLEVLQRAASEQGLEPGIDLAARGSATIGGMVSTNAGGVMAFRNGVMRHRVLGLEVVLPDGTVLNDLSRVVKTTAGYDLKHLFVGAEGTLGIVTRVAVKLDPMPKATATAMLALPSVAAALDIVNCAMRLGYGQLRAAEVLWPRYLQLTAKASGWNDKALGLSRPLYLLLGVGGERQDALQEALLAALTPASQDIPGVTAIIAASVKQERELWYLREATEEIYKAHGPAPSFDVSVPLAKIEDYLARARAGLGTLDAKLDPYVFGHLADGNLHIVLDCPGPLPSERQKAVEDVLYAGLHAMGGSFSAEHGIGSKRIGALQATAGTAKLELMRTMKAAIDPKGIMNPGKVLPTARALSP